MKETEISIRLWAKSMPFIGNNKSVVYLSYALNIFMIINDKRKKNKWVSSVYREGLANHIYE